VSSRVQHEVKDLVAQRLYGLVQGYEDLNDHDTITDVTRCLGWRWANWKAATLVVRRWQGKSTLNRLEQAMHVPQNLSRRTLR
jgi:hypothetical protein